MLMRVGFVSLVSEGQQVLYFGHKEPRSFWPLCPLQASQLWIPMTSCWIEYDNWLFGLMLQSLFIFEQGWSSCWVFSLIYTVTNLSSHLSTFYHNCFVSTAAVMGKPKAHVLLCDQVIDHLCAPYVILAHHLMVPSVWRMLMTYKDCPSSSFQLGDYYIINFNHSMVCNYSFIPPLFGLLVCNILSSPASSFPLACNLNTPPSVFCFSFPMVVFIFAIYLYSCSFICTLTVPL